VEKKIAQRRKDAKIEELKVDGGLAGRGFFAPLRLCAIFSSALKNASGAGR
jgi:hypothetical protein